MKKRVSKKLNVKKNIIAGLDTKIKGGNGELPTVTCGTCITTITQHLSANCVTIESPGCYHNQNTK